MKIYELILNETGPIILWGMYPHRPGQLEDTKAAIEKAAGYERVHAYRVSG